MLIFLLFNQSCIFYCTFSLLRGLLISFVAILSSLVFLTIDYLRRLAIESAKQHQLRLVLKAGVLERTGLGISLLVLSGVMLLLYITVLWSSRSEGWQDLEKNAFLERLGSCATVLLYYINLRNLFESPRVRFHSTSSATLEDISLSEFLKSQGGGQENRCLSCARLFRAVAGEDSELFITAGLGDTNALKRYQLTGEMDLAGILPGVQSNHNKSSVIG